METPKHTVAVLFGGTSSERAVSLVSGKVLIEHLPRDRFTVTPVEINEHGTWQIDPADFTQFDVVFIALHGGDGEGGTVQATLDEVGVPYTGSGAAASQRAMDKIMSTGCAQAVGLTTPQECTLTDESTAHEEILTFGLPAVLKPNRSGSSVGISIIHTPKEIDAAVTTAFAEDSMVVVQHYITGRELTCGVLGNHNGTITPLPPVEIKAAHTFFDYHAKYHATDTVELCPAPLTEEQTAAIQRQSIAVHQALGCDGLTRSDFIMAASGTLYYLETNTIPGMTPTSLCPKEAKAAGLSLAEFFTRQIELALALNIQPQP